MRILPMKIKLIAIAFWRIIHLLVFSWNEFGEKYVTIVTIMNTKKMWVWNSVKVKVTVPSCKAEANIYIIEIDIKPINPIPNITGFLTFFNSEKFLKAKNKLGINAPIPIQKTNSRGCKSNIA